jgi:hypothetical protein
VSSQDELVDLQCLRFELDLELEQVPGVHLQTPLEVLKGPLKLPSNLKRFPVEVILPAEIKGGLHVGHLARLLFPAGRAWKYQIDIAGFASDML